MNASNPVSVKGLTEEFFLCSVDNTDTLLKILIKFQGLLSGAERFKKDAFLNLSEKGFNKLFSLFKHQNDSIRKNSFKVIALLLTESEILQNIFCEKYNFNPIGNVIVLNWFPSELKSKIKLNEHILYEIKKTQNDNLNSGRLYWQWPKNDKYNNDEIPDPQKYLLGIYTTNKTVMPIEEKHFDDDGFNIDDLVKQLEQ